MPPSAFFVFTGLIGLGRYGRGAVYAALQRFRTSGGLWGVPFVPRVAAVARTPEADIVMTWVIVGAMVVRSRMKASISK
jgi:hypothetical protein